MESVLLCRLCWVGWLRPNMLGQKTMGGFYSYDKETRKRAGVNPELLKFLSGSTIKAGEFSAERLFFAHDQ